MTELEMLTPREKQVYSRKLAGERNMDIAKAIGISESCVAVTLKNARARIASGVPATGHVGRYQDPVKAARFKKRMRELARAKKCPVCMLRGDHVCLRSVAEVVSEARADAGPPEIIFKTDSGHLVSFRTDR